MKNISSDLYPKVLAFINETYLDKMDSIESAQVDEDGTIEAIAIDEGARFVCRYQGGAIEIKALEPDKQTNTAAFGNANKRRTCSNGISCGNSCISKSKTCRKKVQGPQQAMAKEIRDLVHQPKGTKDLSPIDQKRADKSARKGGAMVLVPKTPESKPAAKKSAKEPAKTKSVLGVADGASLLDAKKALIKIKSQTGGTGRKYMNAQLEYNKIAASYKK